MSDWIDEDYDLETNAVRAGQQRGFEGEHSEPIFTTSSFVFANAAQAAARFAETEPGNVYSRFTNPTVRTFEHRLAALEGGDFCVATASGMAAILTLSMALLRAGDHVVVSNSVFGSTVTLFTKILERFNIDATFVSLNDYDAWQAAIKPNTCFLYLETPSNPLCELADIKRVADIARLHGVKLVVDNVFCTPALQQPIGLGADIVVHSATKYLDGQGRCIGGAIVMSDEDLHKELRNIMRSAGPAMSPFNAWVFLKGLETLQIRLRAHNENAVQLATWLETQAAVSRVYYPGLKSHPQHELALKQQTGFGGVLSFEVIGGRENAWRVIDATQFLSITANLGDTKTTITHPATTTHGRLTQEQRDQMMIKESLIRASVGLESVENIKEDLARGLAQIEL